MYLFLSLDFTQIFVHLLIPRDIIILFFFFHLNTQSHSNIIKNYLRNKVTMNVKNEYTYILFFCHNMLHIAFSLNVGLGTHRQTKNKGACCWIQFCTGPRGRTSRYKLIEILSGWKSYAFPPAVLPSALAYTWESLWASIHRNSAGLLGSNHDS